MAKFKEILDALSTDMILNIFHKRLSEENDEELKNFINTNQKVNALFGFLREEKLKEITEGNEEMEDEVRTIIRTFVFTLYELHKLDRNLDFKKEMNI